jgi:hypothetical protein
MTDPAAKSTSTPSDAVDAARERRSNAALRALVNEMLERVRELSRRTTAWSPEEREQAEAELEVIMARVRREAARPRDQQ